MQTVRCSVRCGDSWHEVRLSNGRLQFPAHAGELHLLKRQAVLMEFGSRAGGCAKVLLGWRARRPELVPDKLTQLITQEEVYGKDSFRLLRRRNRSRQRLSGGRLPDLSEALAKADQALNSRHLAEDFLKAVQVELYLRGLTSELTTDSRGDLHLHNAGGVSGMNLILQEVHPLFVTFALVTPQRTSTYKKQLRVVKGNVKTVGNVETACLSAADCLEAAILLLRKNEKAEEERRAERLRVEESRILDARRLEMFGIDRIKKGTIVDGCPMPDDVYQVSAPGVEVRLFSGHALRLALPEIAAFVDRMVRLSEASRRLAAAKQKKEKRHGEAE